MATAPAPLIPHDAALPVHPIAMLVGNLRVGDMAVFDAFRGPEKIQSVQERDLERGDGGVGWKVLHIGLPGRFVARFPHEPIMQLVVLDSGN